MTISAEAEPQMDIRTRELLQNPVGVYVSSDGLREMRFALVLVGSRGRLEVQSFNRKGEELVPGSFSATFRNNIESVFSIAAIAKVQGLR